MDHAEKQRGDLAATALGYLPLAWILLLFTFVWRARMALGRWPQSSIDDPKLLPFATHYDLLEGLMLAAGAGAVAMLVLIFASGRRAPSRARRRALAAFFVGWALIAAMLVVPKVDFVNWFLD